MYFSSSDAVTLLTPSSITSKLSGGRYCGLSFLFLTDIDSHFITKLEREL
jgi:hypothetical protein